MMTGNDKPAMTEQQREAIKALDYLESKALSDGDGFPVHEAAQTIRAALSHAEGREFKAEQDLISFLDDLYETAGPDGSALTGQKWAPAQRAIEGIRRPNAEGEAVASLAIDKGGNELFRATVAMQDLEPGLYDLYTHPTPQVAVPKVTTEMYMAACDYWHASRKTNGDLEQAVKAALAAAPTAPTAPAGDIPQVTAYDHTIPVRTTSSDDEQPVSDPDGLPSDWRRVVEGAADMLGESAKQHRGRGDNATAAMCDRFGAMLRDEILSTPAPDEREIAAKALDEMAATFEALARQSPRLAAKDCRERAASLRAGKEGE